MPHAQHGFFGAACPQRPRFLTEKSKPNPKAPRCRARTRTPRLNPMEVSHEISDLYSGETCRKQSKTPPAGILEAPSGNPTTTRSTEGGAPWVKTKSTICSIWRSPSGKNITYSAPRNENAASGESGRSQSGRRANEPTLYRGIPAHRGDDFH
jgi:hypothetical protein